MKHENQKQLTNQKTTKAMKRKEKKANEAKAESPTPASVELEHIRRRAYELYEQQGRQDGFYLEHWLQAERELADKQPQRPAN